MRITVLGNQLWPDKPSPAGVGVAAGLNLVNPSPLAALKSQQDCSDFSHTRRLHRVAHWREIKCSVWMEEPLHCSRFVP